MSGPRKKGLRGNVLLLVLSLSGASLVAELAIRAFSPQDLVGNFRVATDSGLLINKSSGSALHTLGKIRVRYTFDFPGLRDSHLRENALNVLTLGDSFTFGWLLERDETYVQRLQAHAAREFEGTSFNFVNAAAGGWGTAHYVAYVEEFGAAVQPRIVLVFLNTDDIGRSVRSGLYTLDPASGSGVQRNRVPKRLLKTLVNRIPGYQLALENSHVVRLIRKAALGRVVRSSSTSQQSETPSGEQVPRGPSSPSVSDPTRYVLFGQALFLHLAQWCDQNSVKLVVLTTGWHEESPLEFPKEPTKAFMREAPDFFASHGIEFYDLSPHMQPYLRQGKSRYVIPGDGHPNARANQLITRFAWAIVRTALMEYCEDTEECSGIPS